MRSSLALMPAVVPAIVLAAGCSGGDPVVTGPREPPVLRVVGCEPAYPAPVTDEPLAELRGVPGRPYTAPRRRLEGQVSFGMPSTGGALDAAVVRRALTAKLPELRACYEVELARSQQGRFAMAWRLDVLQDGRVLNAMPVAHATSRELTSCVSRALRRMSFPARPGGRSARVTIPLVFEPRPVDPPPAEGERGWVPFATAAGTHGRDAPRVARATEAAVRARTGALAACFPPTGPTGSLRALIELDADGHLALARAGGLGARPVEACVEQALAGLAVVAPEPDTALVACDLVHGDAQSWRVTPAGRYGVIEASRERLRYGDQTIGLGALDPEPLLDPATYLIIAEPDTPGAMLALALVWANEGNGAIVAVRDGGRGAAAPRYVGMGRVAVSEGIDATGGPRPALQLGAQTMSACVGGLVHQAPLADPVAVARLVQRLAARCKRARCAPILALGLEPDAVARDLVEITGAARRAGFARVVISDQPACGVRDDASPSSDDDAELE